MFRDLFAVAIRLAAEAPDAIADKKLQTPLVSCITRYDAASHAHYEREGYCLVRNFVSEKTLKYLQQQVNDILKSRHPACQEAWM